MKEGIAKSGDVDLRYRVEGDGDETILLIMGLGGRSADWGDRFPSALAERYRVVRFDNRGTGGSSVATPGFSLEDMARDAVAVLDAVEAQSAHLVGISMGGMIAQLVALEHAARADRVVLMSTHFGGHELTPPHPDAQRLFDPHTFLERGRDPEAMMRFTLEVITAPGFPARDPDAIEALVSCVRREPTPAMGFMGQLQAIIQSDRSRRVADIPHPTLVLHGTEDKLIPVDNGRKLAARVPNSTLQVLEDCGHMPMWEKPDAVSKLVLDFLSR